MNSSRKNMNKCLSYITPYLLNLILLLFINSYEARASISSRGQSNVPCPRISFAHVYVRDPLDCKNFFICFGRRFWKLSCPGSTVFSSKHKVCVWEKSSKDDCQSVKEKIVVSSTTSPVFTTSVSTIKKTNPNEWRKNVTTTLTTMATKAVTTTVTEMTTARTINKAKLLTTIKREIETKRPVQNTTDLLNNEMTTEKSISKPTVRPLLTTEKSTTKNTGRSSLTTSRTFSTKSKLKLKTKLFPPYLTEDEHVTKWWQRNILKPTRKVPTNPKNEMEYCGEVVTSSYIIGGEPSLPGRWPWQASLQIVSAGQPWHRCGGVLIHPLWIVTAAHCVEGPFYGNLKNWRVVLSEGDLDSNSGTEVYRNLSRIVSHPGYKRASNFPNDIAMLQLNRPVDVHGRNIRMACLPPMENTKLFGHGNCWISGWGETRGSGKQNGLNELAVDIVPNKDCKSMWGRVDIEVLDQQVCVGEGDMGACYGDSGGPLMCEVNGTYYLGGVMSWLINNCSAKGYPNVFTRVQSYLDWIRHNIDYYHWWRYS